MRIKTANILIILYLIICVSTLSCNNNQYLDTLNNTCVSKCPSTPNKYYGNQITA